MIRFYKLQSNQWIEVATYSDCRVSPGHVKKIAYKLGYTQIYSQATHRLTQNFYYAKDCAVATCNILANSLYDERNYLISCGYIEGDANAVYFSIRQSKLDTLTNDELKQLYALARCEDCGQLVFYNQIIAVGRTHNYCRDCAGKHAKKCSICGHWYMKKSSYTDYNLIGHEHYIVCNRCKSSFERNLQTCADCGGLFTTYNGERIRGQWYCYDCAGAHRPPDVIADYHQGDMPIVFQYASDETPASDVFKTGAEIETECTRDTEPNDVAYDIHEIMNNSKQLCKFEHDGSLTNGFEIITQPGSIAWYYEHRPLIRQLFEKLNSYNCSYQDFNGCDRCGLHLHVNRSFFKDYDYENRLCYLFQRLKEQLRVFSQRRNFDYCHFCYNTITWDNVYYEKRSNMQGHGSAINCANRDTIEFRIYRGTTNFEQFMSYIEFTYNLCKLVRDTTDIDRIERTTFKDVVNYSDTIYLRDYCASLGLIGGAD